MKGHLVFVTENGDYSGLSARLVYGSRGNSPGKLSHSWLNTEQEWSGIICGILKGVKQRNWLAPSTFWHMRRYMKIWHPNFDSREMIGSFSEACCYSAGRITFHVSFAFFLPCLSNDKPFNCFRWWREDFLRCATEPHANFCRGSRALGLLALYHDNLQRVTTSFAPAGLGFTNCSCMILRKTFRSNVFGLSNYVGNEVISNINQKNENG